jgi:hypothetical protein
MSKHSRQVAVLVAEQIARGMGYLAIGAAVVAWIWTGHDFDFNAMIVTGAFVTLITSGGHILDHIL